MPGLGAGPQQRRHPRWLVRTSPSKPPVCNGRADDLTSPLLVSFKNSSVGTLGGSLGASPAWCSSRPGLEASANRGLKHVSCCLPQSWFPLRSSSGLVPPSLLPRCVTPLTSRDRHPFVPYFLLSPFLPSVLPEREASPSLTIGPSLEFLRGGGRLWLLRNCLLETVCLMIFLIFSPTPMPSLGWGRYAETCPK